MSAPSPEPTVRLQMHLNLAIQYALLLGVVLGLSQFLLAPSADRIAALKGGFQSGLIAGTVVSVIVGIWQWRTAAAARDRRLAADPKASAAVNPGVRVEQTVRVPLPRTEILKRGESLAHTLDGGRFKAVDKVAGRIIRAAEMNLTGMFGARIPLVFLSAAVSGLVAGSRLRRTMGEISRGQRTTHARLIWDRRHALYRLSL